MKTQEKTAENAKSVMVVPCYYVVDQNDPKALSLIAQQSLLKSEVESSKCESDEGNNNICAWMVIMVLALGLAMSVSLSNTPAPQPTAVPRSNIPSSNIQYP